MFGKVNTITNFISELTDIYIDDNKLHSLIDLLSLYEYSNINIEDHIISEYNRLFNEWIKKYPMFNIPNGILSISINNKTTHIKVGNIKDNAIFDIASITKLYTEVILLKIIDRKDYKIDLNTKISDITSLYPNLDKTLTIMDLISFSNTYKTDEDIRTANSKEEALRRLRTTHIVPELKGYYLYTDLPIMILTDVLEDYTKLSYKELFDKYIIEDLNLKNTFLVLNEEDKKRYVGYDKNTVNDPKANIMGGYYGHAGVKTTAEDIITFMNSIFDTFKDEMFDILISHSKTRNKDYDINGFKTEDITNLENHLLMKTRGLIGNFNIAVDNKVQNDYTPFTLASDTISKVGFAVQGSTRVHAETSIINIKGKEYKTSISILLDISNQYENAKEFEKITGKTITKEAETVTGKYYMVDVRSLLPYGSIYKELVNLLSNSRLLEIYKNIELE